MKQVIVNVCCHRKNENECPDFVESTNESSVFQCEWHGHRHGCNLPVSQAKECFGYNVTDTEIKKYYQ